MGDSYYDRDDSNVYRNAIVRELLSMREQVALQPHNGSKHCSVVHDRKLAIHGRSEVIDQLSHGVLEAKPMQAKQKERHQQAEARDWRPAEKARLSLPA